MSSFTTKLKTVIELTGGEITYKSYEFNGVEYGKLPSYGSGNIGLADYPIFDRNYRDILNGKIIDHYMNIEIGAESLEMFQLFMRRTMNEIMPFYNQLYKSTLIEFDILKTMDIGSTNNAKTNETVDTTSTTDATNTANSKYRAVNSQTPQTMLAANEDYASSAADSNSQQDGSSTASQDNTSTSNADSDTENHTEGYQGLASDLIMRYRDSFLNVDLSIVNALQECFMQVWDTSDEYSNHNNLLFW